MVPKTKELDWGLCQLLVSTDDTLENLRDITQVECVMGLAGCWLHWTVENLIVNFELGVDHDGNAISNVLCKIG